MDTTLPSGPMGIIKFETHFKLQTPPASQAAHSIVSRSGWVRAPGILDGCSNSCPGIGYPMVAMRRKAASIWMRTKDEPVQILSKGFLLRSRRPDHSRSLIMEQLSAAGNAGSTSDLQATSHRNPTSSRATAVIATLLFLPDPTNLRYRELSRTWAFQAISLMACGMSGQRLCIQFPTLAWTR
ncbi:hypothetical protein FB001_1744 [Ensifer sp. SEMIA 135]|nr:hypothetical protein FB000_1694 [Ensifer sp. SEMIA 134]TWB21631.1 hypothetical protein FB001_1744 [Ensifer sp. SEMIA 135]